MRIALLFEFGTTNGGEHSMLAAVDRLRGDHDFVAVAPAEGRIVDALDARGIERVVFDVRGADGRRKPIETLLVELRSVLDRALPDLVHANSLAMARWTGRLRGDDLAVPCTGHLRDIVNLSRSVIADLNRNDRLVAVSRATRDHHESRGLDADRVVVLHNGVDLDRFRPRPATGSLRSELGVDADAILSLAIGQIGLRKGLDVLTEAFVRLGDPQLHLVLVGERFSTKAESVAFDEAIDARFHAAGLAANLHRLGFRDDVPDLMNEADLLVHAAKQEPLGRVLLEAAASGLPIVATHVGGTPEILDPTSALLVPRDDPTALATAIGEFVTDRTAARDRANAARRVVEERFDASDAATRLGDVWRNVLLPPT